MALFEGGQNIPGRSDPILCEKGGGHFVLGNYNPAERGKKYPRQFQSSLPWQGGEISQAIPGQGGHFILGNNNYIKGGINIPGNSN